MTTETVTRPNTAEEVIAHYGDIGSIASAIAAGSVSPALGGLAIQLLAPPEFEAIAPEGKRSAAVRVTMAGARPITHTVKTWRTLMAGSEQLEAACKAASNGAGA